LQVTQHPTGLRRKQQLHVVLGPFGLRTGVQDGMAHGTQQGCGPLVHILVEVQRRHRALYATGGGGASFRTWNASM
jgi:hypothetical protein